MLEEDHEEYVPFNEAMSKIVYREENSNRYSNSRSNTPTPRHSPAANFKARPLNPSLLLSRMGNGMNTPKSPKPVTKPVGFNLSSGNRRPSIMQELPIQTPNFKALRLNKNILNQPVYIWYINI